MKSKDKTELEWENGTILMKCEACGFLSIIEGVSYSSDRDRYLFVQCLRKEPDCQTMWIFDLKEGKHKTIDKKKAIEMIKILMKEGKIK